MFNSALLAERSTKVVWKIIWTMRSIVAKPQIEEIHSRKIRGKIKEEEFVRRSAGRAYIEPQWGYIISENGSLIEDSLLPNFPYPTPPWRTGLPAPGQFFKARRGKEMMVKHYPSIISLRHHWEWNYYHFYLDVLGKIRLFDEIGIPTSTPITLGRYAIELPFVQQIISQGDLKNRNWVVQDNFYILANEIYYCCTKQTYKEKMDYLMDLMQIPNHLDQYQNRIFLTRRAGGPRSVLNMNEITPVLKAYNFEIVDTVDMTIEQQIELFSKTRYFLAVHGAGLTNMIFRRDTPMSVLEIHAENFVNDDFKKMCGEWGFGFDRLACRPDNTPAPQASIWINPEQLKLKIEQMLNQPYKTAAPPQQA